MIRVPIGTTADDLEKVINAMGIGLAELKDAVLSNGSISWKVVKAEVSFVLGNDWEFVDFILVATPPTCHLCGSQENVRDLNLYKSGKDDGQPISLRLCRECAP